MRLLWSCWPLLFLLLMPLRYRQFAQAFQNVTYVQVPSTSFIQDSVLYVLDLEGTFSLELDYSATCPNDTISVSAAGEMKAQKSLEYSGENVEAACVSNGSSVYTALRTFVCFVIVSANEGRYYAVNGDMVTTSEVLL